MSVEVPMSEGATPDFETILKELNQVVEKLERGNLPLEEALSLYERGAELLKTAQAVLDRAQARLEILLKNPDGTLATRPLDPAEFLEET